jgi:hypothetical protein
MDENGNGRPERVRALAPSRVPVLDGERLGYIAALIDGEGSVKVQKADSRSGQQLACVEITQTDRRLTDWLLEIGGRVKLEPRRKKNPKHQDLWRWQLRKEAEVYDLLRSVRPLLLVKGEDADAVLEWIERRNQLRVA